MSPALDVRYQTQFHQAHWDLRKPVLFLTVVSDYGSCHLPRGNKIESHQGPSCGAVMTLRIALLIKTRALVQRLNGFRSDVSSLIGPKACGTGLRLCGRPVHFSIRKPRRSLEGSPEASLALRGPLQSPQQPPPRPALRSHHRSHGGLVAAHG